MAKPKANQETYKLFTPGTGVDIVFNLDSLTPKSYSSIIYDSTPKKKELVIAQPSPKILPSMAEQPMHITTLIRSTGTEKKRMGIPCKIGGFVPDYKLANDSFAECIKITIEEERISEVNIRTAYRHTPNAVFDILGKILFRGVEYYSGKNFKVHDISATGIGILIPHRSNAQKNPLMEMPVHSEGKIGIILKYEDGDQQNVITLAVGFHVARVQPSFSDKFGLAGLRYTHLAAEEENQLSKFIHEAQLHDIRQMNRT